MTTIFDILKKTKKDNCGKCGFPTCMAFAAAVHTGGAPISRCPFIEGVSDEGPRRGTMDDPETALAKELKEKVRDIDLKERSEGLGGEVVEIDGEMALKLRYLGEDIFISPKKVFRRDGKELEPRDQILLYNYLFFGGKGELSGEFVGLESFPNSISKVVTLKRYTEDKIASHFSSRPDELKKVCERLGGKEIAPCHADVCIFIRVLPKVPIEIHFWDEDKEDGFPAKVKVLFDKRALDFLDIESLIFSAERLAETITETS